MQMIDAAMKAAIASRMAPGTPPTADRGRATKTTCPIAWTWFSARSKLGPTCSARFVATVGRYAAVATNHDRRRTAARSAGRRCPVAIHGTHHPRKRMSRTAKAPTSESVYTRIRLYRTSSFRTIHGMRATITRRAMPDRPPSRAPGPIGWVRGTAFGAARGRDERTITPLGRAAASSAHRDG